MKIRAFITHKKCETYSDCQDRFCIDTNMKTVCVSDGMSQSIFPDYWAQILSDFYAKKARCNADDLPELCDLWRNRVNEYIQDARAKGTLHYLTEQSLAQGRSAGATICGIQFDDATIWHGHVLGDSCIVEVSTDGKELKIHASEDKPFDCYPDYYDSYKGRTGKGEIKDINGEIGPDKMLLLVSDPFSEFIYKHHDDFSKHLNEILSLQDHSQYCELVDRWRQLGMHNDDSTLCIVEFDNAANVTVSYEDKIDQFIEEEEKERKENDGQEQAIGVKHEENVKNAEGTEEQMPRNQGIEQKEDNLIDQCADEITNKLQRLSGSHNKKWKTRAKTIIKEILGEYLQKISKL